MATVSGNEEQDESTITTIDYPPKFLPAKNNPNIWIKSFVSLALYLTLGYFIFPDVKILNPGHYGLWIIHELGHFLAMNIWI